jgi:hypothetical protein
MEVDDGGKRHITESNSMMQIYSIGSRLHEALMSEMSDCSDAPRLSSDCVQKPWYLL